MKRLLHATTTRDDFQGLAALEFPISLELEKGIRHLPRSTRIHRSNKPARHTRNDNRNTQDSARIT